MAYPIQLFVVAIAISHCTCLDIFTSLLFCSSSPHSYPILTPPHTISSYQHDKEPPRVQISQGSGHFLGSVRYKNWLQARMVQM